MTRTKFHVKPFPLALLVAGTCNSLSLACSHQSSREPLAPNRLEGIQRTKVTTAKDQDGDGIVDDNDACPSIAGPKSADFDPLTNGCPPPARSAGD